MEKYLKEVLELHQVITTYGDAQGEVSLREALQKYAYSMRGVLCDVDAILIGASFQSLLFLLCGLLDKQMIVGMEKSGFSQAEEVFKSYGFPIVYLSLEEDGISIAELRKHHVQVLYINAGSLGKIISRYLKRIRRSYCAGQNRQTRSSLRMIIMENYVTQPR